MSVCYGAERNITNEAYFNRYTPFIGNLEQIDSSVECSIFKCAVNCLRDIQCKHIQYNETAGGCVTCVLLKYGIGNHDLRTGKVYELKVA